MNNRANAALLASDVCTACLLMTGAYRTHNITLHKSHLTLRERACSQLKLCTALN